MAATIVIGTILPIPFFIIKEWPSNWRVAFAKKFCSGYANYMPDPSKWRTETLAIGGYDHNLKMLASWKAWKKRPYISSA